MSIVSWLAQHLVSLARVEWSGATNSRVDERHCQTLRFARQDTSACMILDIKLRWAGRGPHNLLRVCLEKKDASSAVRQCEVARYFCVSDFHSLPFKQPIITKNVYLFKPNSIVIFFCISLIALG